MPSGSALLFVLTWASVAAEHIGVIGAGYSGLTAALELRRLGHTVTVFDRLDAVGGRARVHRTGGLRFELGPSWYWMHDVFTDVFSRYGANTTDYYELTRLDPAYRMFTENEVVDIPGTEFTSWLCARHGGRLAEFMREAAAKYHIGLDWIWRPMTQWTAMLDASALGWLTRYSVLGSLRAHIERFTSDRFVQALLTWPTIFLGVSPDDAMAFYSFMTYAGHELGTFYPKGGMAAPANALASLARAHSVTILLEHEVTRIEFDGRRATRVCMSKGCDAIDGLVATGDYHHIEQTLLPIELRAHTETFWRDRQLSPACVLFLVGLGEEATFLEHHNFVFETLDTDGVFERERFHPNDAPFYVNAPSRTDPTVIENPAAHADMLFILLPMPHTLDGMDTPAVQAEMFAHVMQRLARHGGVDALNVTLYECFGTYNFTETFHAFRGNAFGLANTLTQSLIFKPNAQSRATNLVYAGHMTHPGPGVPPAMISGVVAANLLHRNLQSSFGILRTFCAFGACALVGYLVFVLTRVPWFLLPAYLRCSAIMRRSGTTYFLGALMFGWKPFLMTSAFYAFMRTADDMVDCLEPSRIRRQKLAAYRQLLRDAYGGTRANDDDVVRAVVHAMHTCGVPLQLFERFFASMDSDANDENVMLTMEDTLRYVDGSAAVVGELMLHVMGVHDDPVAVESARALGIAFQMTNFVRDVVEDRALGRCYIPKAVCAAHGIDLMQPPHDGAKFTSLMRDVIDGNSRRYDQAAREIDRLPTPYDCAIGASIAMYRSIDRRIEADPTQVFSSRIRLTFLEKLRAATPLWGRVGSVSLCGRLFVIGLLHAMLHMRTELGTLAIALLTYAVPSQRPTYFGFHRLFMSLPIACAIGQMPRWSRPDRVALGCISCIATLYTFPWAAEMIRRKIWEYPRAEVAFRGVPYAEIMYFNLAVLLTFVFSKHLRASPCAPRPRLRTTRCGARVGGACSLLFCIGAFGLRCKPFAGSYLASLVAWATPAIAVQWCVGAPVLCATAHTWMRTVACASIYMIVAEAWGVYYNVWMINITIGCLGEIPVEEIAFYILASAMSAWGFELVYAVATDDADDVVLSSFESSYEYAIAPLVRLLTKDGYEHARELLEYNVSGGRYVRGRLVQRFWQDLVQRPLTPCETRRAFVMGWVLEIWHGFLLIEDDIMDNATIRRKKPAWWCVVSRPRAINDGLMLQTFAYALLDAHFGESRRFARQCRSWLQTQLVTGYGQHLDLQGLSFDDITIAQFETIARLKTGLYTILLPFELAMHLAGTRIAGDSLRSACIELGKLYQMRDDFYDIYGSASDKTPRDVEDGKCNWVIAFAKTVATDSQLAALKAHYGTETGRAVVRATLDDMKMETTLRAEYARVARGVRRRVEAAPSCRRTFADLLDQLQL